MVGGFRERLDQFVIGIADEINAVHITGYGISDTLQRPFFINYRDNSAVGINLLTIAYNPELENYDRIAAAEDAYSNEDNRIALKIAARRYTDCFTDEKYTTTAADKKYNYDEFYRNIISDLGNIGQEASTAADAQKLLVDQIDYSRQALSAVSLDEEMTNLIKYEHSYNAATRIVNVIDEMIEMIVNRTGLVGR